MIKCVSQLLECETGWMAEINIFAGLDAMTKVYATKERCKKETEKMAARLNLELNWEE